MAHVILANPAVKAKELAALFGVSESWTTAVIGSDPFQKYLEGKAERVMDPLLRGEIGESFRGLVLQSIERAREKMEGTPSDGFVLQIMQSASRALGYGNAQSVQVSGQVGVTHSLVGVIASLPPPSRGEKVIAELPAQAEAQQTGPI